MEENFQLCQLNVKNALHASSTNTEHSNLDSGNTIFIEF